MTLADRPGRLSEDALIREAMRNELIRLRVFRMNTSQLETRLNAELAEVRAEIAVLHGENAKLAGQLKEDWAEAERLKLDVAHWRECADSHMRQAFENGAAALQLRAQVRALTAALNEALGFHQVTHIHTIIRAALAQSSGGEDKP